MMTSSRKNDIFPVKTVESFAGIISVKLNYESIVDIRGSKALFLLKITPDKISKAASRPVLWKTEVLGKSFLNLINLSKFLAILYHKQTYGGGHFW